MDKRQCDQYGFKPKRRCRRNATTSTPWGEACDKCALERVTSTLAWVHAPGDWKVWAIKELIRQEMKRGS